MAILSHSWLWSWFISQIYSFPWVILGLQLYYLFLKHISKLQQLSVTGEFGAVRHKHSPYISVVLINMLWPTGVCQLVRKSQWWKHRLTMQAHEWVQLYQYQYHPRLISSVTFSFGTEGHFTIYIPFTVCGFVSHNYWSQFARWLHHAAVWLCVCNNTRKLSSCDRQILGGGMREREIRWEGLVPGGRT